MRQGRPRRARRALLLAACSLPFTHTAIAVDIHYARAIGDPYDYRLPARPPASGGEAVAPRASPADGSDRLVEPAGAPRPASSDSERGAGLPGLGTEATAPVAEEGGRAWPRVVIGVLLVGAMAALASKGGGGEGEVQVNAGVDLGGGSAGGAAPPPGSSGGGTPPSGGGSGGASSGGPAPSSGGSTGSNGSGGSGPVITVGTGGSGNSGAGGGKGNGKNDDKGKGRSDDQKGKK